MSTTYPAAVHTEDVAEPQIKTRYPEPFASAVQGRSKRFLGDVFGLTTFGVNFVRLAPGCMSSIAHHHSEEDEFIYILSGRVVLLLDGKETILEAGMCAGFKAASKVAHQLRNPFDREATFLEVGSRMENDEVEYPFDDLALRKEGSDWVFVHKDGRPY